MVLERLFSITCGPALQHAAGDGVTLRVMELLTAVSDTGNLRASVSVCKRPNDDFGCFLGTFGAATRGVMQNQSDYAVDIRGPPKLRKILSINNVCCQSHR